MMMMMMMRMRMRRRVSGPSPMPTLYLSLSLTYRQPARPPPASSHGTRRATRHFVLAVVCALCFKAWRLYHPSICDPPLGRGWMGRPWTTDEGDNAGPRRTRAVAK
ncbi:hypothetical protein LZ30DRAFT_156380 [Colletotrichum cereale]|nr:hypothetical protein LZ30DRAFT_156380 [Colletotrichum cereale]